MQAIRLVTLRLARVCVCRERFPGFSLSTLIVCGPLSIIGYEPAGLTVHPPPKKMFEGGFSFFVWVSSVTKIFS